MSHTFEPALTRRAFLGAAVIAGTSFAWPRGSGATDREDSALTIAIGKSPLVYISPLKSDGQESACHGEVWFVKDGSDLLVVTTPERWRAAAIEKGLGSARLWVGDHGSWKKSQGKYEQSPSCLAAARLDGTPETRTRALAEFGVKYSAEWSKWGPKFSEGLSSGERVLIRYTPNP